MSDATNPRFPVACDECRGALYGWNARELRHRDTHKTWLVCDACCGKRMSEGMFRSRWLLSKRQREASKESAR